MYFNWIKFQFCFIAEREDDRTLSVRVKVRLTKCCHLLTILSQGNEQRMSTIQFLRWSRYLAFPRSCWGLLRIFVYPHYRRGSEGKEEKHNKSILGEDGVQSISYIPKLHVVQYKTKRFWCIFTLLRKWLHLRHRKDQINI